MYAILIDDSFQSLIGKVQLPFLRASTKILPCFSLIIKLFPSKSPSTSNFSFFAKRRIFNALRTFLPD